MPEDFVKKMDLKAKKQYRTRSALLREAMRIYLQQDDRWTTHFQYGERKARELGITNEDQVAEIINNERRRT